MVFRGASQDHHPLLINNCLSMPLIDPWNLFDGGNIVADPIFADSLNGDYSISQYPCIDSGAYRPDLPDFDIRYHKRIVPGATGGQWLLTLVPMNTILSISAG